MYTVTHEHDIQQGPHEVTWVVRLMGEQIRHMVAQHPKVSARRFSFNKHACVQIKPGIMDTKVSTRNKDGDCDFVTTSIRSQIAPCI
jgi:hypothetical protein